MGLEGLNKNKKQTNKNLKNNEVAFIAEFNNLFNISHGNALEIYVFNIIGMSKVVSVASVVSLWGSILTNTI